MKIIITPRRSGKTLKMIKMAAENNSHIVCRNIIEARRIENIAKEMNLIIYTPITYNDFIKKDYCGAIVREFLIDNADDFLQHLTHIPIKAITMSSEL